MSITTIWNVLNNTVVDSEIKRGIEIPMVQRDYAQGRKNNKANEIRKVFLNNILLGIEHVIKEDKLPLELDFIYGYVESETFIPLDGQQRLTTLYLLYWYFAFKEQRLIEFKIPFSKFNYQTRQSSGDFLKHINTGLSSEDFNAIFTENKSFESIITDKNWYFVSWKYDLTIQSVITMLDEIHLIFRTSNILFSDLTNEQKPCIVFNFLNIKNFGLSDDLYIKMNSRGKPLTNFENLKAELGKFIEHSDFNEKYNYTLKHNLGIKPVTLETYFVTKIDTSWTDFFWKMRNKESNEFDDKLLNLLAFVSLNEMAKLSLDKFDNCIKELDDNNSDLSYYKFKNLQLLNEKTIIHYIEILDLLVNEKSIIQEYLKDKFYLNKNDIITASFKNNFKAIYEQRIFFYAIFKFLVVNDEILKKKELKKWDRLIRNLIKNTIYNNSKDFQASIISIDNILESYNGDIYSTFIELEIKGFDRQQIKEEKLKIELINGSNYWFNFITDSESNPYLNGQIIFLLSFSGLYDKYLSETITMTSEEEIAFFNSIKLYYDKFKSLFTETGLKQNNNDELFRRALLVKGNYLLYSTNWSLIIDNHRDISWKRLLKETGNRSSEDYKLKCSYLKELFDDIDILNVDASLKRIINEHNCTDWRKDFIDNPVLINKSSEKYLKFIRNESDNIYVLRKSKYNKYADPEIKSILLKEALLKNEYKEADIELGFIENLNQFGIVRIKNAKPKVAFNVANNSYYLIKQRSKEDLLFENEQDILNYIINNY